RDTKDSEDARNGNALAQNPWPIKGVVFNLSGAFAWCDKCSNGWRVAFKVDQADPPERPAPNLDISGQHRRLPQRPAGPSREPVESKNVSLVNSSRLTQPDTNNQLGASFHTPARGCPGKRPAFHHSGGGNTTPAAGSGRVS